MRSALALVTLVAAAAAPSFAGTVTGTVTVVEKGGRKTADLSDTVIYVEGARGRLKPAKAVVTMKAKTFTPHVVVVPVGGTVEFPNEDPLFHNVFSVSGENRFDLELYKRPKSGSWTFQHAGVARVFCNIHPQMSAIVIVRDNPFFAKAETDGSFNIPDVPAGTYALKAWHERGGEASVEIVVPAEGQVTARLAVDASTFKRVQHKNKFGKDYSSPDERY